MPPTDQPMDLSFSSDNHSGAAGSPGLLCHKRSGAALMDTSRQHLQPADPAASRRSRQSPAGFARLEWRRQSPRNQLRRGCCRHLRGHHCLHAGRRQACMHMPCSVTGFSSSVPLYGRVITSLRRVMGRSRVTPTGGDYRPQPAVPLPLIASCAFPQRG